MVARIMILFVVVVVKAIDDDELMVMVTDVVGLMITARML
jgi:hypothetical protein